MLNASKNDCFRRAILSLGERATSISLQQRLNNLSGRCESLHAGGKQLQWLLLEKLFPALPQKSQSTVQAYNCIHFGRILSIVIVHQKASLQLPLAGNMPCLTLTILFLKHLKVVDSALIFKSVEDAEGANLLD